MHDGGGLGQGEDIGLGEDQEHLQQFLSHHADVLLVRQIVRNIFHSLLFSAGQVNFLHHVLLLGHLPQQHHLEVDHLHLQISPQVPYRYHQPCSPLQY